jgi:galactokinase
LDQLLLQHEEVKSMSGAEDSFPDADEFCSRVVQDRLFTPGRPIVLARAPGRLDVLGGIADYSGSLTLTLPLAAAALAAAQLHSDGRLVAVSGERRIELGTDELAAASLETLAHRFSGRDAWAAYVVGPVALLAHEEQVTLPGLRLLISSDVPEGKGVGSSAAVEVAVLQALSACFGRRLEPDRLALLGQRTEQLFAGAPCGVMDQMTAICGQRSQLLELLCRPAEVVDSVPLPSPLAVWGIDSGVCRTVAGGNYRRVRCAAFMGKALLGCGNEYLAELDPSQIDPERLPEQLSGEEFLRLCGRVDDPVCAVEPHVFYPVRAATLFPLEEQKRVHRFVELLALPVGTGRARLLGELMYASHLGYSLCGLGANTTDELVEAIREAGWKRGLVGARISGGGGGGTVVVLGREDAEPLVRQIADELGAGLMAGSSAGAASFGVRTLANGYPS